jgi:hypothetical protein
MYMAVLTAVSVVQDVGPMQLLMLYMDVIKLSPVVSTKNLDQKRKMTLQTSMSINQHYTASCLGMSYVLKCKWNLE